MDNVHPSGSDEPVIAVDDHFGSGLAVELDPLPHVEAALADLRANPTKVDKLHGVVADEMSRRGGIQ